MQSTSPDDGQIRRIAAVDLTAVAEALGDASGETAWWYDPATGAVEMSAPDWDGLDEQDDDPSEQGLVPIEPGSSRAAYRDMVDFAESVADTQASDLVIRALEGRGAFRRFRDTVREFPDLVEHWHTYTRAADERRAIDWLLDGNHVDPVDADAERAARSATLAAALAAISVAINPPDAAQFDEAVVRDRWDEVRTLIDAGHSVSIRRSGRPWAVISPRTDADRD